MSFGKELQQERLQRDVSLSSIAAATKVSERYLTALEEGDHASLPGGVFNKGIVRSYCRHLGLDEEDWLQRFAAFSRSEGEEDWTEFARNVQRNRERVNSRTRLRWLGVLVMLAALAGLGWAAWHYLVKPRLAKQSAAQAYDRGKSHDATQLEMRFAGQSTSFHGSSALGGHRRSLATEAVTGAKRQNGLFNDEPTEACQKRCKRESGERA